MPTTSSRKASGTSRSAYPTGAPPRFRLALAMKLQARRIATASGLKSRTRSMDLILAYKANPPLFRQGFALETWPHIARRFSADVFPERLSGTSS